MFQPKTGSSSGELIICNDYTIDNKKLTINFFRSYPSCPSRESNTSPIQNSANEHHHQQQQPTATQTEPIKNDQDRPKLQIAKNLLASPVDYSKSTASNSLSALAGLGMGSNHLPSSSLNGKDKKASMSILGTI